MTKQCTFRILMLAIFVTASLSSLALGQGLPHVIIQSPPTVGALPLIWVQETGLLSDQIELEVRISPDHQRGLALMAQNEIEFLVTGVNVGAKAYNKGIDLQMVNTNIWGIDYLLTGGFEAKEWSDLEGKSLSLPLQGGPLDFLARYFLLNNGADISRVDFVYQPSNNGARTFQLEKVDAIILPEPLVTITLSNSQHAVLAFDLQVEWAKLHSGEDRIPFVGLFVQGDFARNNHALVVLLKEYYQRGVDWVKANPEEASALAEKYFSQPAAAVQESFSRINLNIYSDDVTRDLIDLYCGEIMELYPEMIGGTLPDADFYF